MKVWINSFALLFELPLILPFRYRSIEALACIDEGRFQKHDSISHL